MFNVQEAIKEDKQTSQIYMLLRDNFFDQDWTKAPALKGYLHAWSFLAYFTSSILLWRLLA